MPYLPTNFGLLEPEHSSFDTSELVVLPVPFERTTSWGKGTGDGPAAILRASQAMELWDQELGLEPYLRGIATLPPFLPEAFAMEEALAELQEAAGRVLAAGKKLITLGGEHSLTIAPVRAARQALRDRGAGDLGVVQFDAHADLRQELEGTTYSHASVMRRVVEDGLPTLAVGLRSLSAPEAALVRERRLPVIWAEELEGCEERFAELLAALPEHVYLTFDLDFFDPALVPATGTPEPGGGTWYPTLRLLRHLFTEKRVVAADLVELAPIGGQPASDFLAAKLVYKWIGYWGR